MKTNILTLPVILLVFVLIPLKIFSQQYYTNGSAQSLGGECYLMTPEQYYQAGSVWYSDQIDLTQPFDIYFWAFFGWNNDLEYTGPDSSYDYKTGADGICFVLQKYGTNALGSPGLDIGYSNQTTGAFIPSFIVEFDTWWNYNYNDWNEDHIAIQKNGKADHTLAANYIAGCVQASATDFNIEDSTIHLARVTWNPATDSLKVYFDCVFRIGIQYDIINNVFNGDPVVWWGFTAGTGSATNYQYVCRDTSMKYYEATICKGDSAQLDASLGVIGGNSYQWTPNYNITNTTIANPFIFPDSTVTYHVAYKDTCGLLNMDSVTVYVNDAPVDLGPDTFICTGSYPFDAGSGFAGYLWQDGSTTQTFNADTTGIYWVEVTGTNGCSERDSVTLSFYSQPIVSFTANDSLGCEPFSVNFTDNSTLAATWLWNFGDPASGASNTSTSQNPSHLYNNAGTYNVSLYVTTSDDCSGSLTANNMISVYNMPVADFYSIPNVGNILSPAISFFNSSTFANSWGWDFGDIFSEENTSTLQDPAHIYSSADTFNVCLKATTQYGCEDSICKDMIIQDNYSFYVPNVFSPNQDGDNDIFIPKYTNMDESSFEMHIFDRWGEEVYQTKDISKGWDGKIRGKKIDTSSAVFQWLIFINDNYGNRHKFAGHVTLIK